MTQFAVDAYIAESASINRSTRHAELKNQHWTRSKSQQLADNEGINLSDDHWEVIAFLRKHYVKEGIPRHARTLSRELTRHFNYKGGAKYLYQLYAGGPVTQGSRIANLHSPAGTTDLSFGSCY